MSTVFRELAHSLRSLSRRPMFAGLALGLLLLVATSVTAIYGVIDATLLRPLPYSDPRQLYALLTTEPVSPDSVQVLAAAAIQLARWRANTRAFSDVEGWTPVTVSLTGGDREPLALRGFAISAGMLDLLGTPPAAGRSFVRGEETVSSGVAIVSASVAERQFGSARAAIGQRVSLDGDPRTVVGVMPPGYSMAFQGGDVWIPLDLSLEQQTGKPRLRVLAVYGRLRHEYAVATAQSELDAMQRVIREEQPEAFKYTGTRVRPLRDTLLGNQRSGAVILAGALLLVVLVAIANVGNLAFADVVARRQVAMTRIAMGASPASLVRGRVFEGAALMLVASVLGTVLGALTLALLAVVNPVPFLGFSGRWLDARTALVTVVATACVALVSMVPAAVADGNVSLAAFAGGATKATSRREDRRMRQILALLQVVVTVVLITVSTVLTRDALKLLSRRPGFDQQSTLAILLNLPSRGLATVQDRAQYVASLVDAVRAIPGIDGVSTIQSRFILNETMQTGFEIEGRVAAPGVDQSAQIRHVMPDLFQVLGIRILAGRGIGSDDRDGSVPVAVVSGSLARQYWPGESAIGKRIRRRADAPWMTVVGVADEINDAGAGVPIGPTLYVAYLQQNTPTARVTLVARAHVDPSSLGASIRRAIQRIHPGQAVDQIAPLFTLMSRSAAQPRFQAVVVGAFAGCGLLLVLAGIYSLTLFTVVSQRREIGIRAALGATPGKVVRFAAGTTMRPVLIGLLAGLAVSIPILQVIAHNLRATIETFDIAVAVGVVAMVAVGAALASLVPAHRAARVPPITVLRS